MDLASRGQEPLKIQYQQTTVANQHLVLDEQELTSGNVILHNASSWKQHETIWFWQSQTPLAPNNTPATLLQIFVARVWESKPERRNRCSSRGL